MARPLGDEAGADRRRRRHRRRDRDRERRDPHLGARRPPRRGDHGVADPGHGGDHDRRAARGRRHLGHRARLERLLPGAAVPLLQCELADNRDPVRIVLRRERRHRRPGRPPRGCPARRRGGHASRGPAAAPHRVAVAGPHGRGGVRRDPDGGTGGARRRRRPDRPADGGRQRADPRLHVRLHATRDRRLGAGRPRTADTDR